MQESLWLAPLIEKFIPVPSSDERPELLEAITDRRVAAEHFKAAKGRGVLHEVDELCRGAIKVRFNALPYKCPP